MKRHHTPFRGGLPLCCALVLTLGACAGGPERAPHQPIKGVDTEKNEVGNENDRGGGAATAALPQPAADRHQEPPVAEVQPPTPAAAQASFLDDFLAALAAQCRDQPGRIAVFPALSRDTNADFAVVTGLGDFLAQETADGLELRGVRGVIAGPQLVSELRAANRGLDTFTDVEDVDALAKRLGATYAVFGTVNVRDFDQMDRRQSLEIRWNAMELADMGTVASYRPRLDGGSLAQQLIAYHRTPSDWRIGPQATPLRPSLQAEAGILARGLAEKISAGNALRGRVVQIEPTVLASGRSGARARLQSWAAEFARKLDLATRTLASDEIADPEQIALDTVPANIDGVEYASFGAATDAFRRLRNEVETAAAGDLEHDVAAALTEQLRTALDGQITVQATDPERERILDVIRREARASQTDGTVDPSTVATLRTQGTQLLVTSTLRRDLESYKLRATLIDLTSGQKVSYSTTFDQSFVSALDAAINR